MNSPHPYSFRLPEKGAADPWFGHKRTRWEELIRARDGRPARVRSFTDRRAGAKNGVRFIEFASALRYFEQLNRQT